MTADVLARTFQNMARRVQSCLDANGSHCYDVITFLTQWGKSASNFIAISSLVVKLIKKCRVRYRVGQSVFSSPQCPDQLQGTHSLLVNGYGGSFQWVNWPGHETEQSLLSSATLPPCLHSREMEKCTVTLIIYFVWYNILRVAAKYSVEMTYQLQSHT